MVEMNSITILVHDTKYLVQRTWLFGDMVKRRLQIYSQHVTEMQTLDLKTVLGLNSDFYFLVVV